jgi:hypothetical protein
MITPLKATKILVEITAKVPTIFSHLRESIESLVKRLIERLDVKNVLEDKKMAIGYSVTLKYIAPLIIRLAEKQEEVESGEDDEMVRVLKEQVQRCVKGTQTFQDKYNFSNTFEVTLLIVIDTLVRAF